LHLTRLLDKNEIEKLLREDDTFLHLYEIGDLDDLFWPHARYYTISGQGRKPVFLLYTGLNLPCFLALPQKSHSLTMEMIRSNLSLLPKRMYAHLSEGLSALFERDFQVESHGLFFKMNLKDRTRLETIDISSVIPLSEKDASEMQRLYDQSYPGHWFEPHMLQTGYYYGIRSDARLIAAAGVHVYSKIYRVAALGNIATHPEFRGRGLAKAVCAKLCLKLLESVEHIGLNVKADNTSAIHCYENLGFATVARYLECLLERKSS